MDKNIGDSNPVYPINVAASVCGTTPRMLREYEKAGFIKPVRINKQRRFSGNDIQFIKNIRFYLEEVGMTINGLKLLYMMAPCWEIKQCGKPDCPAYGVTSKKCWEAIGNSAQTVNRTCHGCPIYLTYDKNKNMKIHQGKDIGPACFEHPVKPSER